jgi:hypothetical protein
LPNYWGAKSGTENQREGHPRWHRKKKTVPQNIGKALGFSLKVHQNIGKATHT